MIVGHNPTLSDLVGLLMAGRTGAVTLELHKAGIAALTEYLRCRRKNGDTLEHWLRRTEIDWPELCELHPTLREWRAAPGVVEQVVLPELLAVVGSDDHQRSIELSASSQLLEQLSQPFIEVCQAIVIAVAGHHSITFRQPCLIE